MSSGLPKARSRARRAAAEPEELELKYSIDDTAAVEAWLDARYPPNGGEPWRALTITDRYFDTADAALSTAGYGARLRRVGRHTTLTLKADLNVEGGLHRRIELEGPATQKLDARAWRDSEARDRLRELVDGQRLVELFVVRQRRRERHLSPGGGRITASIDRGTVLVAGAPVGDIAQFELEYRGGRRAALQRLARAVEASGLARPEPRSKLAQALEMAAAANRVQADDSLAEAGRKVLSRHLLRMLDREVGARSSDELARKQMRVATRRLRATWRIYADAFKRPVVRHFVGETRRVGRTIGALRDLDVLAASLPDDPHLAPFAAHLVARRAAAASQLQRLLDGKRYDRFADEMLEFTAAHGAGTTRRATAATVRSGAPLALADGLGRMRAAAALAIGSDDAAAWHALRIEARRFRYSVEAFADVLDKQATKDVIERVVRVQDHLGAMNDAAVAIDEASLWLADNGATAGSPAHVALGELIVDREAEIVRLRRGFGSVWRGVSGATTDRLLQRAVQPLTNS